MVVWSSRVDLRCDARSWVWSKAVDGVFNGVFDGTFDVRLMWVLRGMEGVVGSEVANSQVSMLGVGDEFNAVVLRPWIDRFDEKNELEVWPN